LCHAISAPAMVTINARSFMVCVRNGSYNGARIIQLISAPLDTAPNVSNIMGVVIFESSSWMFCVGRLIE